MSDSILNSVKNALDVAEDYDVFDDVIIMHINTALSILHQVGASPSPALKISDESTTWDELIQGVENVDMAKTYIYLKVRNLFDPPTTSYQIEAHNKRAEEIEWRLNIQEDSFNPPVLEN